jgi:hypothetical protein
LMQSHAPKIAQSFQYINFETISQRHKRFIDARAHQKNFAQQSLYDKKHFRVVSLDSEARKKRTPFSFSNQTVFVNCGCTRAPLS